MSHSRTFGWAWGKNGHNLSSPENIHCFGSVFSDQYKGKMAVSELVHGLSLEVTLLQ